MKRVSLSLALVLTHAAGVVGMGCGVTTSADEAPTREEAARSIERLPASAATGAGASSPATTRPTVPARPSGLVEIAGPISGGLTREFIRAFYRPRARIRAAADNPGETSAFGALCEGRIDVVESTRKITEPEFDQCKRRGLEVLREFKVASDALVVATKKQFDVGGDCLKVGDVRAIFRRGSPHDNWADLGFDNLELATAGPRPGTALFSFFAQRVLGIPRGASLDDVRTDYRARSRQQGVRFQVIGRDRFIAARDRARALVNRRKATRSLRRQTDRIIGAALRPGVVGLFSYSYYAHFEEQLRPFEIAAGQCSFPSEEAITLGWYPLAESIVLYTTRTGLARREVRDFLSSFMFSARPLAIRNHLVPLPISTRNDQIEVIEGRRLQRTGP